MNRVTVKVYFTEEEAQLIRVRAGAEALSGFIRRTVLEGKDEVREPEDVLRTREPRDRGRGVDPPIDAAATAEADERPGTSRVVRNYTRPGAYSGDDKIANLTVPDVEDPRVRPAGIESGGNSGDALDGGVRADNLPQSPQVSERTPVVTPIRSSSKFQRKPKTKKDKQEALEEKQRNCTFPTGPGIYCPKCHRRH